MKTNSISFPDMFDVVHNQVHVVEDTESVTNRGKCLILTEPTEVYNCPNQGVGLKQFLWQYNSENTLALIKDRIVTQLRTYEPYCDSEATEVDPISESGDMDIISIPESANHLHLNVTLRTTFGTTATIEA